jgi:hypothetical protein
MGVIAVKSRISRHRTSTQRNDRRRLDSSSGHGFENAAASLNSRPLEIMADLCPPKLEHRKRMRSGCNDCHRVHIVCFESLSALCKAGQ